VTTIAGHCIKSISCIAGLAGRFLLRPRRG
jgi:hypothetical protein